MKQQLTFFLALLFSASLSAQWAYLNTNAGANYNTLWVKAVDANTVWASLEQNVNGYYYNPVNKVVRTIDGGKNWNVGTLGTDPNFFITSIFARNAQECWAIGTNNATGIGEIFVTKNGGQTFEQKGLNTFLAPGSFPDIIHFYDAEHGVILGDPVDGEYGIYTTDDGGDTWTRVSGDQIPDPTSSSEFGFQSVYAVAGNAIMVGTNSNRVMRSTDRGHTWQAIGLPHQVPPMTGGVAGIAFADAQNGLLVYNVNSGPVFQPGSQPKPLRTKDGGLTWDVIENSNGDLFDEYGILIHVPGTQSTFLAGDYDGYAYTKDFGVTWTYVENEKFRIPSVDCVDPENCFGSIWSDSKNTGSKIARWVGYQLAEKNPPGSIIKMTATPNPATGPVTATFSTPLPANGLIYMLDNSNTNLLVEQPLAVGQTTATFQVGGLMPGLYWLKAVVGSQVIVQKFFKQ
jgi:photosystem II stability/assembly factor-like uncharacterized protein